MAIAKSIRSFFPRIRGGRKGQDVSISFLEATNKRSFGFSLSPKNSRIRRATPAAMAEFEARRAELEKLAFEKLESAKSLQESLVGLKLTIEVQSNYRGEPIPSVTNSTISEGLGRTGFPIDKSQIRMPNGPIRSFGKHEIVIALHTDVTASIVVEVAHSVSNVPIVVIDWLDDVSVTSDAEMLREVEETLVCMSTRIDELLEYMSGSEQRIEQNREEVRLALASEYQAGVN